MILLHSTFVLMPNATETPFPGSGMDGMVMAVSDDVLIIVCCCCNKNYRRNGGTTIKLLAKLFKILLRA
jgi:hypothetical protein